MANTAQSIKRVRQSAKRRKNNVWQKSAARTIVKKVLRFLESNDLASAKKLYGDMSSVVDRMASKGLYHKNKSARIKGRIAKKINNVN